MTVSRLRRLKREREEFQARTQVPLFEDGRHDPTVVNAILSWLCPVPTCRTKNYEWNRYSKPGIVIRCKCGYVAPNMPDYCQTGDIRDVRP